MEWSIVYYRKGELRRSYGCRDRREVEKLWGSWIAELDRLNRRRNYSDEVVMFVGCSRVKSYDGLRDRLTHQRVIHTYQVPEEVWG